MLYCYLHFISKCYFGSFKAYSQKQLSEAFYKKVFLQISQNSQKNTCVRASSLTDSNTGVFLLIFQNLFEYFLQNTFGRLLLYLERYQISMIEIVSR